MGRRTVISPRKVPAFHLDTRESDEYISSLITNHPLRELGELRLMEAAYGDGLSIVLRLGREYRPVRAWRKLPRSERRAILETCRWLLSDNEDHLYSFVCASHVLDIEPNTMRERVLSRLKKTAQELDIWIREEAKRVRHEECK